MNVSSDDGIYGGYPPLAAIREGCLLTQASFSLPRPLSLLCANRGHIIYCLPPFHTGNRKAARAQSGHPAQPIVYTTEAHVLEVFGIPYNPVAVGPRKRHHNRVGIHVLHLSRIRHSIPNLATSTTFFPHINAPEPCTEVATVAAISLMGPCRTIVLLYRISVKKDSDRAAYKYHPPGHGASPRYATNSAGQMVSPAVIGLVVIRNPWGCQLIIWRKEGSTGPTARTLPLGSIIWSISSYLHTVAVRHALFISQQHRRIHFHGSVFRRPIHSPITTSASPLPCPVPPSGMFGKQQ